MRQGKFLAGVGNGGAANGHTAGIAAMTRMKRCAAPMAMTLGRCSGDDVPECPVLDAPSFAS